MRDLPRRSGCGAMTRRSALLALSATPGLYSTDPDNIPIQIQDVSYCGGSGRLGQSCP
jgi:hypothetical protein